MKRSLAIFAVTAMSTVPLGRSAPLPTAPLAIHPVEAAHVDTGPVAASVLQLHAIKRDGLTGEAVLPRVADAHEFVKVQQLAARGSGYGTMLIFGDDVADEAFKGLAGESKMLDASIDPEKHPPVGSTSSVESKPVSPLNTIKNEATIKWGDKVVNEIKPYIPIPKVHHGPPVVQKPQRPFGSLLELHLAQDLKLARVRMEESQKLESMVKGKFHGGNDDAQRTALERQLAHTVKTKQKYESAVASLESQLKLMPFWHWSS